MTLRRIFQKLFGNRTFVNSQYVSLGESNILLNPKIETRDPALGHVYVRAGDGNMIDGTFIFESEEGVVEIGSSSYIGSSTFISRCRIVIGNHVYISFGCLIYDHDSHSKNHLDRVADFKKQVQDYQNGDITTIKNKNWDVVDARPIRINDHAWIGTGVTLLKGVEIGRGAIVGANAVVTKNVADWTIVAGNPARVIGKSK